jgi:hypothetical protein
MPGATVARRLIARLRGEQGVALITEWLGWLPIVLVTGLFVWQLLLYTWASTAASNAARTASRAEARGGNGVSAGRQSLDAPLRGRATIRVAGETATVRVSVPLIVPGWDSPVDVSSRATLPESNY